MTIVEESPVREPRGTRNVLPLLALTLTTIFLAACGQASPNNSNRATTPSGIAQKAYAGQHHAPFVLNVVFRPGVTSQSALTVLDSCRARTPRLATIGKVSAHHLYQEIQITAQVLTSTTRGTKADALIRCFTSNKEVLDAGWPS